MINGHNSGVVYKLIEKLQRVMNSAARLVAKVKKFDHISPILKELHWLPVNKRIEFKVLLITFKAMNGLAPGYIAGMVKKYKPSQVLRSGQGNELCRTNPKMTTYGHRAYTYAAPKLWNSLPSKIRALDNLDDFKKAIKTHLFIESF